MKRVISNKRMIGCVAYCIYRQAPGNKPRNFDKIIDYIKSYFNTECKNREHYYRDGNDYVSFMLEEKDIYKFVYDMLFSCQDFKNLNLSQAEIESGITDADDERRGKEKYVFVSRYDHIKEYYDFIDLDACVRNVINQLNYEFLDDDLFDQKLFICKKNDKGNYILENE